MQREDVQTPTDDHPLLQVCFAFALRFEFVRGVLGSGGPSTKQTWVRNPRLKDADRSVGSMSVEVQCALLTLAFLRRSPPWLPINSNFLPESMAVKVNRFNGDQHIARRVTTCFRRGISSTRSVGSQPSMSKPLNIGHRIGDTRPSSYDCISAAVSFGYTRTNSPKKAIPKSGPSSRSGQAKEVHEGTTSRKEIQ